MDPIPFYVVKDFWDYAALALMAIGALGSAFAAYVALQVGVLQHLPRARASVTLGLLVGNGPPTRIVQFRLVNTGNRRIVVDGISWNVRGSQLSALQFMESDLGATVPTTVQVDTNATWGTRLVKADGERLLESIAKALLMPDWQRKLRKLHVRFDTAVGKSYTAKVRGGLRDAFAEACKRLDAGGSG